MVIPLPSAATPQTPILVSTRGMISTDQGSNMNLYYAIVAEDAPGSLEKRLAARPDHLVRLNQLKDAGRLLLAGPFPAIDSPDPGPAGFTGSLIVAAFDSLEAAQAWADADPYGAAGVYARVSVKPFKRVLP
jgi:uncharacterized protein YciI